MYSPELEQLIQASLADGVLDDNEKIAIAKRAQAEGVDLAELEIYINSLIQKRVQNEAVQRRERAQAHEKERRGNVCPHCGTQIPPMTKLCPNCGQAVNSNETSGDKELFELIDKIGNAIIAVKSAQTREEFDAANAESEILLKKADLFYGENKKVQALKLDMEQELVKAKKKFRNTILRPNASKHHKKCIVLV